MANRYTATEKWTKSWFCGLSPTYKLFFLYLCENCNNAGIWEVNWPMVRFHIHENEPLDPNVFGSREEDGIPRVIEISESKWFLRTFVLFQQRLHSLKDLNNDNPAHRQIITILQKEKIIDVNHCEIYTLGAMKGLVRPTSNSSSISKLLSISNNINKDIKSNISMNNSNKRVKKSSNFVPPTIEEVIEYAFTRGNKVEPHYFFDRNTATDWVDKNGNKYKDWKAVYRTWEAYGKTMTLKAPLVVTKRPIELVVIEMVAHGKTNHEILHDLVGKYTEHSIHEAIGKIKGEKK